MPYQHDQYWYTADEVEVILLSGPSHYIDHLDRLSDVERAFRWLALEYPTAYHLVRAVLLGYTLPELARRLDRPVEWVDAQLVKSYERMALWLNGERENLS